MPAGPETSKTSETTGGEGSPFLGHKKHQKQPSEPCSLIREDLQVYLGKKREGKRVVPTIPHPAIIAIG